MSERSEETASQSRESTTPNALAGIYAARFEETGTAKRNQVWKVLCDAHFNRMIGADATVLDIACGYGEFINNIAAARKFAIDLNPDAAQRLGPDVTYHMTPATDLSMLEDGSIDVAFTSNFLEHLPSKVVLDDVFAEVLRVLRPGGRFIVLGPNIRYAYAEYWDYYDHYLPLSHLSLEEGMGLAGFEVTEVIPRFLPYTMKGKTPTHPLLVRAYLAIPLAWKVLGKQFLVTARKPSC